MGLFRFKVACPRCTHPLEYFHLSVARLQLTCMHCHKTVNMLDEVPEADRVQLGDRFPAFFQNVYFPRLGYERQEYSLRTRDRWHRAGAGLLLLLVALAAMLAEEAPLTPLTRVLTVFLFSLAAGMTLKVRPRDTWKKMREPEPNLLSSEELELGV